MTKTVCKKMAVLDEVRMLPRTSSQFIIIFRCKYVNPATRSCLLSRVLLTVYISYLKFHEVISSLKITKSFLPPFAYIFIIMFSVQSSLKLVILFIAICITQFSFTVSQTTTVECVLAFSVQSPAYWSGKHPISTYFLPQTISNFFSAFQKRATIRITANGFAQRPVAKKMVNSVLLIKF